MVNGAVALQLFFRQTHLVHGVPSDLNDSVVTTIESADSMHVDP